MNSVAGLGSAFDRAVTFQHLGRENNYTENGKTVVDVSFGKTFSELLDKASVTVNLSERMSEQFILDPQSIDHHDVTIAVAEANMAVKMTKGGDEGGICPYKKINKIRGNRVHGIN